jgi:AcrR family transcriptional regulator
MRQWLPSRRGRRPSWGHSVSQVGPERQHRSDRRETIIAAAAELFSERGFSGTGIDAIGEAAGITGPGVYRYFENKGHVLNAVASRGIEQLIAGVADIVADTDDPVETLEALMHNLAGSIVRNRAAYAVLLREQHHLDERSRSVLGRSHRLHFEEWVHALLQMRPELTDAHAHCLVQAAFGLAGSLAARNDSGLPEEAVTAVVTDMAMNVLLHTPATG